MVTSGAHGNPLPSNIITTPSYLTVGTTRRIRYWDTSNPPWSTNRNPVTNETILDGWAESTSHDTECVTGTPCPTSVKNISFVTEWLRLGRGHYVSTLRK